MANVKFSQLTNQATLQTTDFFPIVRPGAPNVNYRTNINTLPSVLGFANLGAGFSLTQGSVPAVINVTANSTINQDVSTTATPTFSSAVLTTLSANQYVKTDGGKSLISQNGVPVVDLTQGVATGNIYYGSGTSLVSLGIGSAGQFLTVVGGVPSWTTSSATIPNPLIVGNITISGTSANSIASSSGNLFTFVANNGNAQASIVANNPLTGRTIVPINDNGAVYLSGADVLLNLANANAGTAYPGRQKIIGGYIAANGGGLIQSGGIQTFQNPSVGTYILSFPSGFNTPPFVVATNASDQNPTFVVISVGLSSSQWKFLTYRPVFNNLQLSNEVPFNFMMIGQS